MKNVIILHAMSDSPNDYWYLWLKSQLEQKAVDAVPTVAAALDKF